MATLDFKDITFYKFSGLKNDLFRVGICFTPTCQCGVGIEDAYHYFLVCPLNSIPRTIMLNTLTNLGINHVNLINTLLWGDSNLPYLTNVQIILAVQSFIKASKRFYTN